MEEFDNNIKKLLFHNKLLTLNHEIILDKLNSVYLFLLLSKLLQNFNYNIYKNDTIYLANSLRFNTQLPEYYSNDNKIYNLTIDGLPNIDKNNILIIPIILKESLQSDSHIVVFLINFKHKHILYYDSYGIKKNDKIINLRKKVKLFLLENNIIDKFYKVYSINSPWQIYISDDTNPWLYNGSCLILLGLFIYLYFSNESDNKFETIINFGKLIKKDPDIMKNLAIYTYIAITTI